MFVGHYSVSFVAKAMAPEVPLWVLFVAVQLLDVIWAPLILLGIEKVRIVPGFTATNPLDLYYMPYTHSLVAAIFWSVAGVVGWTIARGHRRATTARVVAAAVFSHWLLDFVVHRPDLPLYDDSMKVGLGLWNYAALAFMFEVGLLIAGMYLYLGEAPVRKLPFIVLGLGMIGLQLLVFFGSPPPSDTAAVATAFGAYLMLAAAAYVLERRGTSLTRR